MSDKTGIGWTDSTWNPVVGCTKVSQGCKLCYAKALHDQRHKAYHEGKKVPKQYAQPFETVQLMPERLSDPLSWRKPRRIFVNSMSDLFHPDVPESFLAAVFAVMVNGWQHQFQILTKRPERMRELLTRVHAEPDAWLDTEDFLEWDDEQHIATINVLNGWSFWKGMPLDGTQLGMRRWPLPNVWLGTSVENQAAADERIPHLLTTPAAIRFLSCEPLLGPIDLPAVFKRAGQYTEAHRFLPGLDWVIVGGESGPNHRPMQLEWLERIVSDCHDAGIPVFVKQDSGRFPGKQGRIPGDLWLHQFPDQTVPA